MDVLSGILVLILLTIGMAALPLLFHAYMRRFGGIDHPFNAEQNLARQWGELHYGAMSERQPGEAEKRKQPEESAATTVEVPPLPDVRHMRLSDEGEFILPDEIVEDEAQFEARR